VRVLVLHDVIPPGAPPDQVDALVQAEVIRQALEPAGHVVGVQPFRLDPEPILAFRPDVVFNLVETVGGDGRPVHLPLALLDLLGIPYTGSRTAAMAVSTHKRLAKRALAARGIAVPEDWPAGGPRWIVKSLWEHSSIGLADDNIVSDDVPGAIDRLRGRLGGEVVAETYIEGRELNVSLVETPRGLEVLPLAEIDFSGLPAGNERIVGYAAKWDPESPEYHLTPRTFDVPDLDHDAIRAHCRAVFHALGCRGYVRVDLRIPADGVPRVLEVNANPCLSPDAGFAAAVERAGYGMDEVVRWIVAAALDRR
jgi:D-alanine-D-alanine ligase